MLDLKSGYEVEPYCRPRLAEVDGGSGGPVGGRRSQRGTLAATWTVTRRQRTPKVALGHEAESAPRALPPLKREPARAAPWRRRNLGKDAAIFSLVISRTATGTPVPVRFPPSASA